MLDDIKVVDLGSYVAGPAAATVLSDFGADVVKVEPLDGDPYRRLLGGVLAEFPNFFWAQDSRNKRSVAVDFTTDRGREVVERLIARADVVITNYRPALLERLRFTYDDVRKLNANVIYGQVNSYGLSGADADRTGFDATAWWARSGLMDHVRGPGLSPAVSAPGMGDHPTCMSLFAGIMAALYRRQKTGEGAHVHTSLVANGVWAHSMLVQGALVGFDISELRDARDSKQIPLATTYRTKDERTLLLAVLNPQKEWPGLAKALGHEEWLTDPRFVDRASMLAHREALHDLLEDAFASETATEWCERLDHAAITYSLVSTMSEVVNDEQLYANDILTEMAPGEHIFAHTVNSPVWIDGVEKRVPRLAPDIGQNTREVLTELGYGAAEVDAIVAAGVVGEDRV